MFFDSLQFAIFFAVVYVLYILLQRSFKLQNRMLLVASYVFYGAWDWRFLSLIVISTVVDYISGRAIQRLRGTGKDKLWLALSVVVNLSLLGFFKYFGFFAGSLSDLLAVFGMRADYVTLNIVLPVGISFYTFQTMSYTIDIYRRQLEPCDDFLDFALFVAFFPQLVAGPIERARNLIPQITRRRTFEVAQLGEGVFLVMWGLYKKVVIADNLAPVVDQIFGQETGFAPNAVFIGVLFFAFQIYCDFSGYSDIARGLAKLLGMELMVNFNLPYFARNPSDFWRRWHISLSGWLRDYLYIGLGGNRGSERRTYRNLMLTMILGGLWHGAAWNFVVWGIYHGGLLAVHRFWVSRSGAADRPRPAWQLSLDKWVSIAVMFVATLYGWLLFRASSLTQVVSMTGSFFDLRLTGGLAQDLGKLGFYVWPLVLMQIAQYRNNDLLWVQNNRHFAVRSLCAVVMIYGVVIWGSFDGPSFIYFQF